MEKLASTGLSKEAIIEAYKHVVLSRLLDERIWQLTRIGKTSFNISGQGHEVGLVAMALAFDHDKDFFLPYYRDMTACMVWGMSCTDVLLATFGKDADPNSHGRQMPNHFGSKEHNIVSHSSPVSTQYPVAAGVALANKLDGSDSIALTTTGEGSFNQGECAEAMNISGVMQLPVIFVVENNGYAISVPAKHQYHAESLALRGPGYGFEGERVDGFDFAQSYKAFKKAVEKVRQGGGPHLIELMVTRLTSHSSDDDQTVYRSKEELEEVKANDPIKKFKAQLIEEGYLTEAEDEKIYQELQAEVDQATDEAEASPDPTPESLYEQVYAD